MDDFALSVSVDAMSVVSLAPSDASQTLVLEELSAIHSMVEAKTKELAVKESDMLKYRKRLDAEIRKSQQLLEQLSETLLAQAESTLKGKADTFKKRIADALDSADKKLESGKERLEEKKKQDTKLKAVEDMNRDMKVKLAGLKASFDLLKTENASLRQEVDGKNKIIDRQKSVIEDYQKQVEQARNKPPPVTPKPQSTISSQTETPQYSPLSALSSALSSVAPADSDACAIIATQLLLNLECLPDGIQTFCEAALIDRICLTIDCRETEPSLRLIERCRLEALRRRLSLPNSIEAQVDLLPLPSIASSPFSKLSGVPVQLYASGELQKKIVRALSRTTAQNERLSTLLWCLGFVGDFACPADPQLCQILFLCGCRKFVTKNLFATALSQSAVCMRILAQEALTQGSSAISAACTAMPKFSISSTLKTIDLGERENNTSVVKVLKRMVKTQARAV